MDVLALKHITKTYPQPSGEVRVLDDISLSLAAGEVVALLGASGSGKTTLLQIAGLLAPASSGVMRLGGEDVSALSEEKRTLYRRNQLGFVYQFHHLLPEFTAQENVILPQLAAGITKPAAMQKAAQLLEEFGMSHRLQHRPAQLSGGEMQRVAIARALANNPQLLLADEPTGNLDDAHSDVVFSQLLKAVEQRQMAALIVTHNTALAKRCQRVLQLENGRL